MRLFNGRIVFDFLLVVFLGILVLMAFSYSDRAKLIPLLVGIPTFAMAAILLAADAVPSLGRRLAFVRQRGLVLDSGGHRTDVEGEAPGEEKVAGFDLRTWRLFGWLALLALLMRYTNYLWGVPLFVLLIMRFEAKEKWSTSILTAIGVGVFDLVLFRMLLQATF